MFHYVYLLRHSIEQVFYIGVRSSEATPEHDLGVIYFTSSRIIKKDFAEHPEDWRKEILGIYRTREEANEAERHEIETMIGVSECMNRHIPAVGYCVQGITKSDEARQKISQALKGKTYSDEARQKMSQAKKGNQNSLGHILSAEARQKIAQALKGKTQSTEHKLKVSQAQIDRTLHVFERVSDNLREISTQNALRMKYGLTSSHLSALILGKRKSHKGWKYIGVYEND